MFLTGQAEIDKAVKQLNDAGGRRGEAVGKLPKRLRLRVWVHTRRACPGKTEAVFPLARVLQAESVLLLLDTRHNL